MSARKLPFVVQPKAKFSEVTLGTEESGKIKVEQRNYITVGEKALVQEAMKGSNAMGDLYAFVTNIAADSNKTPDEVLSDLGSSPTPDYLLVWMDDAAVHMEAINLESARRKMIHATAILISRVDSEWSINDTMELHSDLVEALSEFYVEEGVGLTDALEDAADNTGAEGKE